MTLSSAELRDIVTQARPLIEQQLELAEKIAGFRTIVSGKGGDWAQLKALIKAQIQDENDEAGGERVQRVLDKADAAGTYAALLGWGNLNEENFSGEQRSGASA